MDDVLNSKNDIIIKANAFINPILPTQGLLAIGDKGMEFRASKGSGFIQIPWNNITQIRAEVFFGGKYIRGFDCVTDEGQTFNFVASNSLEALRIMRNYLGSEKMVKQPSNFKKIFNKK